MPPGSRKRTRTAREEDCDAEPVHVRRVARKLRGRRGSLEPMPHVPLDVIFEILSYLHPRDLLSLARTSKPFRALLLNRENAYVWRDARRALPGALCDPHPLLSEPALANLMFFPHCHHCGRSPVYKVIWPWLKRYCAKCLPRMAIRPSDIAVLIATGRVYAGPSDLPVIYNRRDREGPERYHALQVERFEQQWRDAGDAPETYVKLYEDQRTHVRAVIKFANELQDWSRGERLRREEQSREQRFASTLRRLRDAGWGPELEFHEPRIRTDREGPAKVLSGWGMASNVTNKEWLKLYDSLKDYMAELRRIRRSEQTLAVFHRVDEIVAAHHKGSTPAGQASRSPTMRGPTAIDIAWMTEGAKLIAYDPGDMSAVDAHLTSLTFRVPQLIKLWEERFKDRLRERVHLLCPYIPPDIDPLDLAIAVFGCLECDLRSTNLQEPALALRYPDILAHRCFYEYDGQSPAKWPPIDHEYQETIRTLELGAQHPRCPIVLERISMAAAWRVHVALVKIRWDPAVVLFSDMMQA